MLAKFIRLTAIAVIIMITNTAIAEEPQTPKNTLDIAALMKDHKIGRDDAPIKIEKYASFTCNHCASFEIKTMPEIKKQFIDTGIVQFIYKSFPLDDYAMQAELMVKCADGNKFFDLTNALFSKQQDWFKSGDTKKFLMQLGELAGINEEKFNTCTSSKELNEAIRKQMNESYQKHKINAVPALVINNGEQIITGYRTVDELAKIIKDTKTIIDVKQGK